VKRREIKFVAGSLQLAPDRIATASRPRTGGGATPRRRTPAKVSLKRRLPKGVK
jgi:hypothetical protein